MMLMLVYLALILAGNVVAYSVGLVVERPGLIGFTVDQPQTTLSLAVFLGAYFLNLWVAWQVAVRLTAPKAAAKAAG